jgi:hypothetical protein
VPLKRCRLLCTSTIRKMIQDISEIVQTSPIKIQGCKGVNSFAWLCFEKKTPGCLAYTGLHRKVFPLAQPFRSSKVAAAVINGGPATVGAFSGPQHCPCDAGFSGMQNPKVVESSTWISKEGLGSQSMCGKIRMPVGSPWEGNAWNLCEWNWAICNGDPRKLEMPVMKNIYWRKLKALGGDSRIGL